MDMVTKNNSNQLDMFNQTLIVDGGIVTTGSNSDNIILSSNTVWGNGLTQNDLMIRDTVLVVDTNDIVIGSASKKESHIFSIKNPYGILHRAFSVFLFDLSTNRLLIHKRASDKITFPNVWTNTCCSHPLFGMDPPEIDSVEDCLNGTVPGVKNAAVRKLQHELGIPYNQLSTDSMKFLTRLHYWAADTITHGIDSMWGEHEIDYVLFMTINDTTQLIVQPNPEEIDEIRWVSPNELEDMLNDENKLFSPWFRLIYYKWMKHLWWKDLHVTMNTNTHVDCSTIHTFDPPSEHYGGAGNATARFAKSEHDNDINVKTG